MQRYQHEHTALGSTIFLTLVTDADAGYATATLHHLTAQIDRFEQQFSRFKEDSELTAFNRRAGERTPISPAFRQLLETAQAYHAHTAGLYNPFILPALQRAGYRSSWPSPHDPTSIDFTSRTVAPGTSLEIGKDWARIPPNTALDFGGIGKGYLLDMLVHTLAAESLDGYWLSLGGDIVCCGRDLLHAPWQIGVQDAHHPERTVRTLIHTQTTPAAIATSGITKRRGTLHGKDWHHIIDPRTGRPAETSILTATVTADTATAADVYAKTIVIGGIELARRYKKNELIRSCIVQVQDGQTLEI
jgi:thiamine biosynthesis lipoprotein